MSAVDKFMRVARTGALALGFLAAVAVTGTSAGAGVLDGHASAFNDGNGPAAGAWTASTAFDNLAGVAGTIDWTVFGPGSLPFAGFAPGAGELTYTFQIFSTGAAAIHSLTLSDPNSGMSSIGTLALAGEAPISTLLGSQAEWNFSGLDAGENSVGLAFSSIKTPDTLFGIVVNGGSFAIAIPLPVPGSVDIPEPASMALLGLGGLVMLRRRS